MAIFQLTRVLDAIYLNIFLGTEDNEDLFTLIANGWPKSFMLFYDDTCDNEGMLLFSSTKQFEEWSNAVLMKCGKMGYCEKLIRLYNSGIIDIVKIDDRNYDVKTIVKYVGLEYLETKEHYWITEQIVASQKKYIEQLSAKRKYIFKKMTKLVYQWRTDYIGYNADPEVDEYYQMLGELRLERMIGIDNFAPHSLFGGYTFSTYCKLVAVLMGLALKHIDFCLALLEKYENQRINICNILTIWSVKDEFISDIANALNINRNEVETILTALTLSNTNLKTHCVEPDSPFAPYIKIGNNMFLRSISGMLNTPIKFMLKELRRLYPQDWDKAVQLRERIFRDELYQLFPEKIKKINYNIFLRREDGTVITDIDATLIDLDAGVIGLFQLKWNEHFILYGREHKKVSFYQECNEWIINVLEWFNNKLPQEISMQFGIKRSMLNLIKEIKLFILGRNYAHFSGDEKPSDKAAWGLWPQAVRIFKEKDIDNNNPIVWLYNELNNQSPFQEEIRPIKGEEQLIIGDIIINLEKY